MPQRMLRECSRHGVTTFAMFQRNHWRCVRCDSERITALRRVKKARLLQECGGKCISCGFDHPAALHFHHRDKETKSFGIGGGGLSRSMARLREEAQKCDLLCANCHAIAHAGEKC